MNKPKNKYRPPTTDHRPLSIRPPNSERRSVSNQSTTSERRPSSTRPPTADHRASTQCWKLTLEYDGTKYHGWQEQANAKTIQGELQKAAEEFFGTRVEVGGAGRTDAGVHALAQVAHLKFRPRGQANFRPKEILYGLNDRLPADICLLDVAEAHPNFHARHDAGTRSYIYQISTRKTAFAKKQVWWVKDKLDVTAMAKCAELLVGRHDFAAFSKQDPSRPDESTIVVVKAAEITNEAHLILFRITASHFLWNMVRRIVGTLVEVGRHNLTVEEFTAQLRNESRSRIALTAPPSGLFLEEITYPKIFRTKENS